MYKVFLSFTAAQFRFSKRNRSIVDWIMYKRFLTFLFAINALLLSVSISFALPECPENQESGYDNCLGTYQWDSGTKYIGDWQNGQRHGHGVQTWSNGEKYIGKWRLDQHNGLGTHIDQNGTFIGYHKNNERIGKGIWILHNGATSICKDIQDDQTCKMTTSNLATPRLKQKFLELTKKERKLVQINLLKQGRYFKKLDGKWGQGTLAGLASFSADNFRTIEINKSPVAANLLKAILSHTLEKNILSLADACNEQPAAMKQNFLLEANQRKLVCNSQAAIAEPIKACLENPKVCADAQLCSAISNCAGSIDTQIKLPITLASVPLVQLGAFKSVEGARSAMSKIRREFSHLFLEKEFIIQTSALNNEIQTKFSNIVYQLRILNFLDIEDAHSFCLMLKQNGIRCFSLKSAGQGTTGPSLEATNCNVNPRMCTVDELCIKSTRLRNGLIRWRAEKTAENHVRRAKKIGALENFNCGVLKEPNSISQPSIMPKVEKYKNRRALVIGNSYYLNQEELKNPIRDARAIAKKLEKIGFEVIFETNLSRRNFQKTILDFGDSLDRTDISLIYFAGHGLEIEKEIYLIPSDAELDEPRIFKSEAIPLDQVIASVEKTLKLSLILIDACRDNTLIPYSLVATRSLSRGLTIMDPQKSNQIISFSAQSGRFAEDGTGQNSPYAAALVDLLDTPNLEIGKFFRVLSDKVQETTNGRQRPVTRNQLTGEDFYLVSR